MDTPRALLRPLRLRLFQPAFEAPVIALIEACYAGYDQRIELDTLDDDLRDIPGRYGDPRATFRVLFDADRLVGTVALKPGSEPGRVELKRVFLDPAWRGRGLGKGLCLWAAHRARRRGFQRMTIWSDTLYATAHGLYLHLGAADCGVRRSLGGVNDVDEFLFELDLA